MIAPRPAAVNPRVTYSGSDDTLLLEDEVRTRLESGEATLIEIVGVPGSGKSTAIAHLAHVFAGEADLLLADRPTAAELQHLIKAADRRLVVCASPDRLPAGLAEHWWLSPWTRDECIEYLLSMHHDRCAAVMGRIEPDAQRQLPGGLAELWTAALDRLAADEQISGTKTALQQAIHLRLATPAARNSAREFAFKRICESKQPTAGGVPLPPLDVQAESWSLLRHIKVQMLLAAEYLAAHLFPDPALKLIAERLPEQLVRETALLVRDNTQVIAGLHKVLLGHKPPGQAMAASLLHAAGQYWLPRPGRAPQMAGAFLSRVQWPGVRLRQVDWSEADLRHADLSGAQLDCVFAFRANLAGARFRETTLKLLSAVEARVAGADFTGVRAKGADLRSANLCSTEFADAILIDVDLAANLSGARFGRADLSRATLTGAIIDGADFRGANFYEANLSGLTLRAAEFVAANFARASMIECDLEYMRLPAANFKSASLNRAYLTGSQMPGACFRRADLRSAGLAEIDWERADLRRADLTGSTFHLGSSRSGLVGSPIASEGSRTGFYTDEYHEQGFKSPEEIRKANLRGADLRGARLDDVDFYLVDLRDAIYTPKQEEHFRRCGAILEAHVS
jgi:uncharacterized protein YjbI with pentapeptide repeats/energy-coupling factor transporter ATP-binding protein EcfA2